ncbi:MAG: hypothetical protein HHJ12_08560 [Glaciimonas sp.]|nr:hypothetical protein [Glaciimonas sp.]
MILTLDLKTYNHHIPQRALNHLTPIQVLQNGAQKNLIYSLNVFINRRNLPDQVAQWLGADPAQFSGLADE